MKAMRIPTAWRLFVDAAAAGCGIAAGAGAAALSAPPMVTLAAAAAAAVLVHRPRLLAPRHAGLDRLEQVAGQIDHIMIGAAETSHFIDSIKQRVDQDLETTEGIVGRAAQTAQSTEQIAQNAAQASAIAADVRNESMSGAAQAQEGRHRINEASRDAQAASALMADLQERSRHIYGITETINEIAMRTNLLALNAAIEAARAGEHGRGFAVVAGEVRQLALRTKEATDEIGTMVREIAERAERATEGMAALAGKVMDATQNVERVHALLDSIEKSARDSESAVQQIATASREHVDTTRQIADAVTRIRDGLFATHDELPRATRSAMLVSERGETLVGALAELDVRLAHDPVRTAAQQAAEAIGALFERAIANGDITEEALFDRRYTPISGTNPTKYSSAFDTFTDQVLPPIQERILEDMPMVAYAGAVDDRGYFPTHNRRFSQPLTGDYAHDLVHNRTKRIFTDRTGSRCGSHTQPFLLQTYKRDTGEVMHDLSAPIYVHGRHWGGFRVGYRSGAAPEASTPAHAATAPAPAAVALPSS